MATNPLQEQMIFCLSLLFASILLVFRLFPSWYASLSAIRQPIVAAINGLPSQVAGAIGSIVNPTIRMNVLSCEKMQANLRD